MKTKFEFLIPRSGLSLISQFLFVVLLCLPLFSEVIDESKKVRWKGMAHYHYDYKKLYQWNADNQNCSLKANSDWNSALDVFMIVSFEGREGGSASEPKTKAAYYLLVNTDCQWKRDHEICAGKVEINAATWEDRQKGTRKVSPGHTGQMTTNLDTKGYKSEASLDLYVDEESRTFTLMGQGEVKAPRPVFKSEEVFCDACSGETDRKTENQTYPDTGAMWFFNVQGKFSGNVISGTEILEDDAAIPEGEKDTPTCNTHMSCGFPTFRLAPTEFLKRKTVSWNFRRVDEDDCLGMVTYIRGDVKINGKKTEIGPVPLSGGSSIETGPEGRVMIVFPEQGVEYRFGSNTSLKLPDPCKKVRVSPDKLLKGMLYVLLSSLVGSTEKPFRINCGWGGSGVRGTPLPILEGDGKPVQLASLKPVFFRPLLAQSEYLSMQLTELVPNEAEMQEAVRVFTVERIPDDYLRIQAVKGAILLKDSSGEERILDSGETFRKSLKPGEEAGPMKEIFIVVDKK